jgi:hypothetical protein
MGPMAWRVYVRPAALGCAFPCEARANQSEFVISSLYRRRQIGGAMKRIMQRLSFASIPLSSSGSVPSNIWTTELSSFQRSTPQLSRLHKASACTLAIVLEVGGIESGAFAAEPNHGRQRH